MRALGVVRPTPNDPDCAQQHGAINDYCRRHEWEIVHVVFGTEGDGTVDHAIDCIDRTGADALIAAYTLTLAPSHRELYALVDRGARAPWGLVVLELGIDTTTPAGSAAAAQLVADAPRDVPTCARPLPPPELARRVSGTGDLELIDVSAYEDLELLEAALGSPFTGRASILDFGCGCGRLMRRLADRAPGTRLVGCDIDADAIAWVRTALAMDAVVTGAKPPLPFADGSFDLVMGYSVFTHLDESRQDAWLAELRRVLGPGGVALLTVHGPTAWDRAGRTSLAGRPTLPELGREREARGIVHWRDDGWDDVFPDWYHTTFHTPGYVRSHWSTWFDRVEVVPGTARRDHDIVVAHR